MDSGVAHEDIVTVGRHLLREGEYSSEGVDVSELLDESSFDMLPPSTPLNLPHFNARRLEHFKRFETCGGGREECLAEVELFLEMKDLAFTRLEHLTY